MVYLSWKLLYCYYSRQCVVRYSYEKICSTDWILIGNNQLQQSRLRHLELDKWKFHSEVSYFYKVELRMYYILLFYKFFWVHRCMFWSLLYTHHLRANFYFCNNYREQILVVLRKWKPRLFAFLPRICFVPSGNDNLFWK